MNTFILRWPNKDPNESSHRRELPVLGQKTMQAYLKELHLIGLRLRCRFYRDSDKMPLRMNYIPRSGDVIVLRPDKAMS